MLCTMFNSKGKKWCLRTEQWLWKYECKGDKGLVQDLRRDSAQGQLTQLPGFHLKEAMRTVRGPAP